VNGGERIEPDGERKQVTVLFADVMGSMDMAEGQDPEQWRRIMQGFFSILADEVERFEGTVDTRSNLALIKAVRGEAAAGVALGRRNCELTERLGDVFSRSLALSNLGASDVARERGMLWSLATCLNVLGLARIAVGAGDAERAPYTPVMRRTSQSTARSGSSFLASACPRASAPTR